MKRAVEKSTCLSVMISKISISIFISFFLIVNSYSQPHSIAALDSAGTNLSSYKATDTEQALSGISLSDLFCLKINVASGLFEKITDAPATVSAYSTDLYKVYGFKTIKEYSEITPGYSTYNENADAALVTRGGRAANSKNQLMRIDDIPVNDVRMGRTFIEDEIPTLFAKSVEFLRGPASALYGIGAFDGVINIHSKDLSEPGSQSDFYTSYGIDLSNQLKRSSGHYATNKEGDIVQSRQVFTNLTNRTSEGALSGSFSYSDKSPTLLNGETGGKARGPYRDQNQSIFGRIKQDFYLSNGVLTAGAFLINRSTGYGFSWSDQDTTVSRVSNGHRWTELIPYIKNDLTFNEKSRLTSYLKYQYGQEWGTQTNDVGWYSTNDTLVDIQTNDTTVGPRYGTFIYNMTVHNLNAYTKWTYSIMPQLESQVGFEYDGRGFSNPESWNSASGAPNQTFNSYREFQHTYSQFVQARLALPIIDSTVITAGLRLDEGVLGDHSYFQPSPRVAILQRINEELSAKVMYGTALHSPGATEYNQNDFASHNQLAANDLSASQMSVDVWNSRHPNNTVEIKDLVPETDQTIEANVSFLNSSMYLSGTGFYNSIDHQIVSGRGLEKDTVFQHIDGHYINISEKSSSVGGELETRFALPSNVSLALNGSYSKAYDTHATLIPNLPILISTLGLSKQFDNGSFVSVNAKYPILYSKNNSTTNKVYVESNKLDKINMDVAVGHNFNSSLRATLRCTNLLESKVDGSRPFTENIPGRILELSVSTSF